MGILLFILRAGQAALSGYAGYFSYHAITNLRQYEKPSEKAAKYLNEAGRQLHKTRTTQASGALALVFSTVTASVLTFYAFSPTLVQLIFSLFNVFTTVSARHHMHSFWSGKWNVPFVEGYNKGIENSKKLKDMLDWIAVSWVLSSVLTVIG